MALKSVSIRMDEKLKKDAEELFSEFGMNMTTAVTIFLKAVVRQRKIPFEITADDPFYSEANMSHLTKSIEQLDKGKSKTHDIVEVEDE